MAVNWNQFRPANLRRCWHDGTNLKPSCTTSLYTGGNPTAANQLKRSVVDAAGNVKKSMTNAADSDFHASMKPPVNASVAESPFAVVVPDSPTTSANFMSFTMTWNEEVTGFAFLASDLEAINGVLGDFQTVTSGLVYTVTCITTLPGAGSYGVRVLAGGCESVATGIDCRESQGTVQYIP